MQVPSFVSPMLKKSSLHRLIGLHWALPSSASTHWLWLPCPRAATSTAIFWRAPTRSPARLVARVARVRAVSTPTTTTVTTRAGARLRKVAPRPGRTSTRLARAPTAPRLRVRAPAPVAPHTRLSRRATTQIARAAQRPATRSRAPPAPVRAAPRTARVVARRLVTQAPILPPRLRAVATRVTRPSAGLKWRQPHNCLRGFAGWPRAYLLARSAVYPLPKPQHIPDVSLLNVQV